MHYCFCPMRIWRYITDYFSVAFPVSCQMCGGVLYSIYASNVNGRKSHPLMRLRREKSERGYKLMLNMSPEEQQALKPITRCAKITVDLTHEEQLLFCAQIKTLGPQLFTVCLWIILLFEHCYHGLSVRCCYTMKRARGERDRKVTLGVTFYNIWSRVVNHIWTHNNLMPQQTRLILFEILQSAGMSYSSEYRSRLMDDTTSRVRATRCFSFFLQWLKEKHV